MITTGRTVGLAEGIIDDTCLVFFLKLKKCQIQRIPSVSEEEEE